ncbi:RNA-binding protein [Desulfopila sp. IMCC35006]|uniref:Jag family protein n=1 Tax=Desulfopila sp. IMCC35006 TaxID=2569542 RepID=UPI0010AC3858|nr:protein jag [Desulfopila sp. IMCC35006]TKB24936.1 RNA-binding protein [Desulfopila sp. IMCC35006]
MSLEKKDFYGKEVALAIKNACDTLGVAQEKLEIEVVETGTTGIFGLIRKKAHIRVLVKPDNEETDLFAVEDFLSTDSESDRKSEPIEPSTPAPVKPEQTKPEKVKSEKVKHEAAKPVAAKATDTVDTKKAEVGSEQDQEQDIIDDDDDDMPVAKDTGVEVSPESLEIVKTEILHLVELMGFPSTVEIETAGQSVACTLRGEFEENLTGVDGKVLDSLQYILRKIISRKVPERLRISINVGDFREKRLDDLKLRAVELAAQVKEDGKTQVLPALNPSERRVIHMILQEDNAIRSRSVGDGLFKKILIYKPGKGNKPTGRKRPPAKGRQNKSGPKKDSNN